MADLGRQLEGYELTTAQIIYHMPDHDNLLQEFIWQEYDLAPHYPTLHEFINFWVDKIEGKLHSVYVARQELITHSDYRFADWQGTIQ